MIAPTSVSSRFSARPNTPPGNSIISFSITSLRPSIFATPSPISRTVPTFDFVVVVFRLEICDSISCRSELINGRRARGSNRGGEAVQAVVDTSIPDIAAELDAQAANQIAIHAKVG